MKYAVGLGKDGVEERLEKRGVSRREFMQFCAAVAAVMGLGPAGATTVAHAVTAKRRPSVVWLHLAECTGCSEAILRTVSPFIDELILDTISLDYHETIMAAAGEAAEGALHKAIAAPEGFVLIAEGAVPTIENGAWGKVGGKTMLELVTNIGPKAKAVINVGTCSSFGGVQAAKPNPSGAVSVAEVLKSANIKCINIPGCPPNPLNMVGAVVHLLTKGLPELDDKNRPVLFYGKTVHELCPRLPHFEKGEFAPSFDSEEARKGYCLYELGCKGPQTFNNCPTAKFNQTSWPVQAGHPCIGCSEPHFWDAMSPFYESA